MIYNTSFDLSTRILNDDGSTYGNEVIIEADTNSYLHNPRLASLTDGGFIICYAQETPSQMAYSVYGQIFNENGTMQGEKFNIHTSYNYPYLSTSVISLLGDWFISCYCDFDGSYSGVYGQKFSANGTKKGQEFQVNTYTNDHQNNPHVSSLTGGGFIVCWVSREQDGNENGIFAKYYKGNVHPLQSFSLISPADDETVYTQEFTFNWQQASSINLNLPYELEYSIYIDEHDDFSSPRIITQIYDTTCTVNSLTPGAVYFWKVLVRNIANDSLWSTETNVFFVSHDAVKLVDEQNENPTNIVLFQNYPNPFNPVTTIKYILQRTNYVKIEVFNLLGQKVETLLYKNLSVGIYEVIFTAKDLPSGVYLYRIKVGKFQETKKMILLR